MPGQTPRRDSEDTRQRVLEAGRVNVAAINYHFGGGAALYGELLVMAHRRVVAQDALYDIAKGDGDPVARLRQLIDLAVASVAGMGET